MEESIERWEEVLNRALAWRFEAPCGLDHLLAGEVDPHAEEEAAWIRAQAQELKAVERFALAVVDVVAREIEDLAEDRETEIEGWHCRVVKTLHLRDDLEAVRVYLQLAYDPKALLIALRGLDYHIGGAFGRLLRSTHIQGLDEDERLVKARSTSPEVWWTMTNVEKGQVEAVIRLYTYDPVIITTEEYEDLLREVQNKAITDILTLGDRILLRLLKDQELRYHDAKARNAYRNK